MLVKLWSTSHTGHFEMVTTLEGEHVFIVPFDTYEYSALSHLCLDLQSTEPPSPEHSLGEEQIQLNNKPLSEPVQLRGLV